MTHFPDVGSGAPFEGHDQPQKWQKWAIPDDDYRNFHDVSEHSAGGLFQVA
ncbi:MAG: hypothetical protein M1560_04525 [Gammaproteobacteria bacterium]|uniref:Uncharacterized protein n=1 Tax=Acidithiobacillus ferrooxidans (strain ATCC 23270 / DSM 14882 / CIP 104768 / NCIMB 8455) TaxID=243159 RepID=B7JC90_ACIF2|nr:hypothetical protein [Acidithiobacillus ferrooxidans]ACK78327.1 hypothetical protein AFE_1996 [Acidithiobacillus ferrooxidans ATCC 23270]MCL5956723.1 hypothetical protein [Gammaproteobacteria bacterium]